MALASCDHLLFVSNHYKIEDDDLHSLYHGTILFMPMTESAMACAAHVLAVGFDHCQVPGDVDSWSRGDSSSPGFCFASYRASCTRPTNAMLTAGTNIRHIGRRRHPSSVPAFEIRWRDVDLNKATTGPLAHFKSRDTLSNGSLTVSGDIVTASLSKNEVNYLFGHSNGGCRSWIYHRYNR
ncbi:hypothetical protein CP532_4745 [Ophiocordyceps camponoti-leonardi (nom. inval.)]|nr:hypothetical protein CP532_4745 [Ophiocordyceps camponoti-leonardi (nom. inval.)]